MANGTSDRSNDLLFPPGITLNFNGAYPGLSVDGGVRSGSALALLSLGGAALHLGGTFLGSHRTPGSAAAIRSGRDARA